MQFVFDHLLALIFFGAFLTISLTFQSEVNQINTDFQAEIHQQENMFNCIRIMDFNFAKMGYNSTFPNLIPGALDSTQIYYYTDMDNDATVDSVRFFLSDTSDLSHTENPSDRILYRQLNGGSPEIVLPGVVDFKVTYLDGSLSEINYADLGSVASVNNIRAVRIEISTESGYMIDNHFAGIAWQKTYAPINLRN